MNNKVFCIIPTFNRKHAIKDCIEQLGKQSHKNINIVVINDGSRDGTAEYLDSIESKELHVINGDGNFWWGKSINEGFSYTEKVATQDDFVLLLNDDIYFNNDLISNFLNEIKETSIHTILGAAQANYQTSEITDLGFSIDFFRTDIQAIKPSNKSVAPDALPGRGLFMSVSTLKKVGKINTSIFRQAHGDLEFTSRAKEKGINLSICLSAVISTYEKNMDADTQVSHSFISRLTSGYTTNSIRLKLTFFSIRGPYFLRISGIPRYIYFKLYKNFLNKKTYTKK